MPPSDRNSLPTPAGIPVLAIAATFTAEPVQESISFWLDELEIQHEIRFAPYNQVFQSILDPGGLLNSNPGGVNVVLARAGDWDDDTAARIAAAIRESHSAADWILVICPSSHPVSDAQRQLAFALPEEILAHYPVPQVEDPAADALGHVPYTQEFFVALGTWVARRIHALRMTPYKVLTLDCDNTLWMGICGEDGPLGVTIGPAQRALHSFAIAQREAGMLLCLCSKNNEADVFETFRSHPDSILQPEHFAAWRINWEAKSQNLTALAEELSLGLDSFVFVDDDRRECAEVIADCPAVLTLPLPENPSDTAEFFRHVWAFDRARVTEADRRRAVQYTEQAERNRAQRHAGTLAEFLSGLKLQIEIRPALPDELPRVAQLTQRTNQMNFSSVRRSEAELREFLARPEAACLTVHVSDRFGDYGLVGAMLFTQESATFHVDTFLLSCRALGRGVEHRMLAHLGGVAERRGITTLNIPLRETARNAPAREFLAGLQIAGLIPAAEAARIVWSPGTGPATVAASEAKPAATEQARRFDDYARIANDLRTSAQIARHLRERRRKRSGRILPPGSEPQSEMEGRLAAIWADLLGVEPVGREESFFDLGGHSLMAIQLLSRIRQEFAVELTLDVVYGGPLTVADLARTIELGELGAISPAEYEALLAEIEALPDDEVRALLAAEENQDHS